MFTARERFTIRTCLLLAHIPLVQYTHIHFQDNLQSINFCKIKLRVNNITIYRLQMIMICCDMRNNDNNNNNLLNWKVIWKQHYTKLNSIRLLEIEWAKFIICWITFHIHFILTSSINNLFLISSIYRILIQFKQKNLVSFFVFFFIFIY